MEYVSFGSTELKVSRVGLGGIPIQRSNPGDVKRLIDKLVSLGVNYIDTARGYTVSEEYLGIALEGRREKFVIATKSMSRTYDDMKRDIGISLKNLKTDYIDIYQIHNVKLKELDIVTGENGALKALLEAKKEGKIHHIGLTAHAIEVFEKALSFDWVESLMFPYNLVETQGKSLIEECAKMGKAFIVMKPLAGGAIENAGLAMRYVCSDKNVTIVIPGMYSEKEAEDNCLAAENPKLTAEDFKEIEKIRKELGDKFCRRCGYCAPCTVGIDIPTMFLMDGYLTRYGLGDWAKTRYENMTVKADACIGCGLCEKRCPYDLPIREMLKKCVKDMKEYEKGEA